MSKFHYPKLSSFDLGVIRSPGPGLGNLLFPIFRALVQVVREDGGFFVYPTMPQFKLGPLIRLETDKRTYWRVLRSRSLPEWIRFSRIWTIANHLGEEEYYSLASSDLVDDRARVITYQGLRNYFHDREGFESYIKAWVEENMISPSCNFGSPKIVIHVRQGDFSAFSPSNIDTCYRTPINWYVNALNFAKDNVELREPILLLTDGNPAYVAGQLGLSEYALPPKGYNALQTIMLGSRAEILIASKSTFSMWMRFLGQSRILWEPDFDISKYFTVTRRDLIFL